MSATSAKPDPAPVRTVPRGYFEPDGAPTPDPDDFPEAVVDEESGELIGHSYVEPILPGTAQETNAE